MFVHGPTALSDHCSCIDSKGKEKDNNSDMLLGRWLDTVDPSQGRGDCGNR